MTLKMIEVIMYDTILYAKMLIDNKVENTNAVEIWDKAQNPKVTPKCSETGVVYALINE